MGQNTGKPSEREWAKTHDRLGKRAYYHRFVDASEIRGKTGTVASAATPQPSDFLLVLEGITSFCEVKSSQNKDCLPFSILNKNQTAHAKRILAAGGEYWVYAHALLLHKWFRIPYQLIEDTKALGQQSLKWLALQPFEWTLPDELLS